MIECIEEDNEVCRPSQGHAAVELLDLVLEELLQLRSFCLQRWRQEPILNGEHLIMDVDVLHLEEEMGVLQSPYFYNKLKKGKPMAAIYPPAQTSGGRWLCPDAPNPPGSPSSTPVDIRLHVIISHFSIYSFVELQPPTRFLHTSL